MTATTPPDRLRFERLGLSLGATLLLLGCLELTARFFGGPLPELPRHDWITGQFEADPYLKWVLSPGVSMGEGERINAQGMRDLPLNAQKPAGQRRFLVLGDSSVFGAGVRLEETFVQRLEASLNPAGLAAAERSIQVLNGGVPGYSTYQCLERLRRSLSLGLDGVILYNISDSQSPEGPTDDFWFRWGAPAHLALRHLSLYRWLHQQVLQQQRPRQQAQTVPDTLRVHLRHYRRNLVSLRRLADGAGASVFYVVPPMSTDADARPPPVAGEVGGADAPPPIGHYLPTTDQDADANQARLDWLEGQHALACSLEGYRAAMALDGYRAGVPVVDGPATFKRAWKQTPEAELPLLLDPVHPSPEGHRLLAQALRPVIAAFVQAADPGWQDPAEPPAMPPAPPTPEEEG